MNPDQKIAMYLTSTIAVGASVFVVTKIISRLQEKKARQIRFDRELNSLQMLRDSLADGTLNQLPPEVVARLLSILSPLIEDGLIK